MRREAGSGTRDAEEECARLPLLLHRTKTVNPMTLGCPLDRYSAELFQLPNGPLMSVQSYRDLKVWNIGVQLTLEVYRITESFPGLSNSD
jgi:hypothetical protein